MKDLKSLFVTREEHFAEYTMKIFGEIVPALGCVTTYLSDIDNMVAQGTITWEDVTLVEDMLVFLGTVSYAVGTAVRIGNQDYPVTEENEEDFEHIVHISLPFSLVDEGQEEKIMEHLYASGSDRAIDDYIEAIVPDIAKLKIDEAQVSNSDFDLSELSEEQLQALKLSTIKGSN